jgi:hypothetical protein
MARADSARRLVCAAAILWLSTCAAGCGLEKLVLGTDSDYLFIGYDTLALPGEEVAVKVRLQSGGFLRDRAAVIVRFVCEGFLDCREVTDNEGFATTRFRPPSPGDYLVTATVEGDLLNPPPAAPATILVACRTADAPLAVVDLDKTLVASGFKTVLVGQPQPMPGSRDVMARLARDFTPVYLTHRVDYLGPKSQAWLKGQGYPRGPLLLADVRNLLESSGSFKSEVLQGLRQRFRGRAIGIGDKPSDAQAYAHNGLEALLLLTVPRKADAGDLRALARSLADLPEGVQVVTSWPEIERAVFDGQTHSRSQAQTTLRLRAESIDPRGPRAAGS